MNRGWNIGLPSRDSVFSGMDVINDALEAAVTTKDKSEWTPVSVNVAPATLTILSKQVREEKPGCTATETLLEALPDF